MKGGDADEFIDYLMDGGASVRHKGYVYHFSGLVYHPGQQRWRVSIEKYRWTKEPFEDFMELVYHSHPMRKKTASTTSPKTSFGTGNLSTSWKRLSPGSTGKNLPRYHPAAPSAPLHPYGKRTAEVRTAMPVLHQQYKSYGTAKN